ncbi:AraC family transcriptional regulator [Clostridium sp. SHJSY1]|uniref:AraC family transcriptional regulator n=1 Tax=Clostridium sp. SHJSY1 TaxID=2942483 RepID=UPI002874B59A|nr:AraC family transcriptional regulator [Clostridium sp. SHJSY1]MDS0527032.1 AraC family transcriptional regulator [Clostridium sp. SHJSY1]
MFEMKLGYFTNDESFPLFIQYGYHDEGIFRHKHKDFSELVIVIKGSANHIVDDEKFYIKKGDVFVISNDTIHGYEETENFRIINIMYRPEILFSADYDIKKSAGFHALFVLEPYCTKEHGFKSRLGLKPKDFDRINVLIDFMVSEYANKADGWQTLLGANFMILVTILSRLYSFDDRPEKSNIINIAKSISYIENHYTEDISIDVLAETSHYSSRHFSRIFSETYNTTPLNYILSLRINKACRLLKERGLTISDVAFQCGFSDNNYFSRIFKKRVGLTPKQFRVSQ